jgi:hypothetical protein
MPECAIFVRHICAIYGRHLQLHQIAAFEHLTARGTPATTACSSPTRRCGAPSFQRAARIGHAKPRPADTGPDQKQHICETSLFVAVLLSALPPEPPGRATGPDSCGSGDSRPLPRNHPVPTKCFRLYELPQPPPCVPDWPRWWQSRFRFRPSMAANCASCSVRHRALPGAGPSPGMPTWQFLV